MTRNKPNHAGAERRGLRDGSTELAEVQSAAPDSPAHQDARAALCWTCNYNLSNLPGATCPECGRGFDLTDPRSVNRGTPPGLIARWALARPGRGLTILAFAAAALTLATARPPVPGWHFSLVDLNYYGQVRQWRDRLPTMTGVDRAYCAGLALAAAVVLAWLTRAALRCLALFRHRPPADARGRFWRPTLWPLLGLLLVIVGIGVGWPNRLGQRHVADVIAERSKPTNWAGGALIPAPGFLWGGADEIEPDPQVEIRRLAGMTAAQERFALHAHLRHAPTPAARVEALNLLNFDHPADLPAALIDAIPHERDAALQAAEIRMLGYLAPTPDVVAALLALLADARPAAREAAADALALLRGEPPTAPDDGAFAADEASLAYGRPAGVTVAGHYVPMPYGHGAPAKGPPLPTAAREALERTMLAGPTAAERDAAARALVLWPAPAYRLRYAEWGVFMADPAGNLRFVHEQLAEIPPFVHRIGNPAKDLADRIHVNAGPFVTYKPVIHLTADRPLAVDLEVRLRLGRPWVAYPMIDDLVVRPVRHFRFVHEAAVPAVRSPATAPIQRLDPRADLPPAHDLREGFPWNPAKHRVFNGPTIDTRRNPFVNTLPLIDDVGVRWQSIIVSPSKLPWMTPAVVGPDPRFQWWDRLRTVDSAWVSNRGESDRFLYYDGPAAHRSPVTVRVDPAGRLRVTAATGDALPTITRRRAVYVRVTPAGDVATLWVDNLTPAADLDPSTAAPTTAADAALAFRRAAQAQGLTESEAAGMADCWRPAFFQAPGHRLLTFMSRRDYDETCPMQIRPRPTESARVGVLWTELPPHP